MDIINHLDKIEKFMDFSNIFVWIIGAILFFLLLREIVTWYWKINKMTNLLEKIEKNTRKEGVIYSDDDNYISERVEQLKEENNL